MTTKQFDCVEMVETVQEQLQEELETMPREEQLAFWLSQTDKLRKRQMQVKNGLVIRAQLKEGDNSKL